MKRTRIPRLDIAGSFAFKFDSNTNTPYGVDVFADQSITTKRAIIPVSVALTI